MPDDLNDGLRWVEQAACDLAEAQDLRHKYPRTACFYAQQAAEKALQGVLLGLGLAVPRTHSVEELYDRLPEQHEALGSRNEAMRLDRYYVQTRYPDSLPGSVPSKHFTSEDAAQALPIASRIVGTCARTLDRLQKASDEAGGPEGASGP